MRKGNVILFKINVTFREGMLPLELYEATRGVWRIGEPRKYVEYAMAVAGGIIREVYRVERWDKAGTHEYKTRKIERIMMEGRSEFSGQVAEDAVRQYVGRETKELGRNSFSYVELSNLHTLLR